MKRINKKDKEYLKNRILRRKEMIKLIENSLINVLKNDINLCDNLLRSGLINLKSLEKRTIKLNKYLNEFLQMKGGLKNE